MERLAFKPKYLKQKELSIFVEDGDDNLHFLASARNVVPLVCILHHVREVTRVFFETQHTGILASDDSLTWSLSTLYRGSS